MAAASVVSAVAAVVSTAYTIGVSGPEQKKAAARQEALQRERMALEAQQREVEANRQKQSMLRVARAKRASLITAAASQGVLASTSVSGAINAIGQGVGRELDYASQMGSIAGSMDAVNSNILALNKRITMSEVNNQMFDSVFKGVGTLATNWDDASKTLKNWFGPDTNAVNQVINPSTDPAPTPSPGTVY